MKRQTIFGLEVALLFKNRDGTWYEVKNPLIIANDTATETAAATVELRQFTRAIQYAERDRPEPPAVPWLPELQDPTKVSR